MARPNLSVSKMTGLWRVKANKIIKWPISIMHPEQFPINSRGKAGYVVDLDRREEALLLFGQEKHLEPVPSGKKEQSKARGELQDQQTYPRPVLNELVERGYVKRIEVRRGKPIRREKLQQNAASQDKPSPFALPGLDEGPGSKRVKRPQADKKEGQADAGAGDSVTS